MRVVAGRWGGRRLQAPPGNATRPTSDRVREALFSILGDASGEARQYDLVFLDPPYRLAGRLGDELTAALAAVLAPGATVVTESDRRTPLDLDLPISDERRYGDTLIRIHGPR